MHAQAAAGMSWQDQYKRSLPNGVISTAIFTSLSFWSWRRTQSVPVTNHSRKRYSTHAPRPQLGVCRVHALADTSFSPLATSTVQTCGMPAPVLRKVEKDARFYHNCICLVEPPTFTSTHPWPCHGVFCAYETVQLTCTRILAPLLQNRKCFRMFMDSRECTPSSTTCSRFLSWRHPARAMADS